jgi:hypothetical protein
MAKRRRTNDEVRYGEASVMRGAGGETHQAVARGVPALTTQQGTPLPTIRTHSKSARAVRPCSKTFIFARKSFTSTTSAYPNASYTHEGSAPTASSKTTNL